MIHSTVLVRGLKAAALSMLLAAPVLGASSLSGLFDRNPKPREEFLPVEKAFRVSATATAPGQIRVTWVIAPGYYLYQKRLRFSSATPTVRIGAPPLPAGESHTDEYFGTQTVYRNVLQANLAVTRPAGVSAVTLSVGYQGCADAGLCYPPQTTLLTVALPRAAP